MTEASRSRKARGQAIAGESRELARVVRSERVRYWQALLARPYLAAAIVHAIRMDLDAQDWRSKLSALMGIARTMINTGRARERDQYRRACARAAQWLAVTDLRCGAADACHAGIALWAGRQLPEGHRWAGWCAAPRLYTWTWRHYWREVERAKGARERARNRIVTINEGLVISATAQWAPWATGHLSLEDLYQMGRIGVMVAADRYDPDRAVAFSTYAHTWIQHYVWREHQLRAANIRTPIAVQGLGLRLRKLMDGGQAVTPEQALELCRADRPDGKLPTLAACQRALEYLRGGEVSLDQPVNADADMTIADVLPDPAAPQDEQLDRSRIMARLADHLGELPEQDRMVVRARYGLDGPERTAAQLARSGVGMGTAAQIEAVEQRTLARLRVQLTG